MKFSHFLLSAFIVLSCSCGSKKKATVAEVAPEICNCFSLLEKDIVMLKEIIISVGDAADPNKYLKETIENIRMGGPSPTLDSDLEKLSKVENESTPSGACFKKMHEKYKGGFDFKNEALANELIVELKKQNCAFAAAMLSWKWKR